MQKAPDSAMRSQGPSGVSDQRETLPALRQPVHTFMRCGVPFTVARTRWMLGLKRRFVILRDQGRLLPKPGFLAQMSQTAATVHSSGKDSEQDKGPKHRFGQPHNDNSGPGAD